MVRARPNGMRPAHPQSAPEQTPPESLSFDYEDLSDEAAHIEELVLRLVLQKSNPMGQGRLLSAVSRPHNPNTRGYPTTYE